jgi:hypothetical protein
MEFIKKDKQKNNKTGYQGISRTTTYSGSGQTSYIVYSVAYKKNGKPNTKKFYVSKYGSELNALREAIKFRKQYEIGKERKNSVGRLKIKER